MHDVYMSNTKNTLDRELHDLAQPMASLQCRLEIGLILGGEEALNEAVSGGLDDLRRISAALTRMRKVVADLKAEVAA